MGERVLAIDVGTNTVLAAVGHLEAGVLSVLEDQERIVGLGRGLGLSGRLSGERIAAALEALEAHMKMARHFGCTKVAAVGTSALRDAANRDAFLEPAAGIVGVPIEVITGLREASLTYGGASVGIKLRSTSSAKRLVCDIGGGSTEVVQGTGARIESAVSLDIGSVRLFERCIHSDPPSAGDLATLDLAIEQALDPVPRPDWGDEPITLLAVAGTAVSIALLVHGHAQSAHGARLLPANVEAVEGRLAASTATQRAALPHMIPGRSDVLVAGARILRALVRWAGATEVVVSEGGVRYGLLSELLGV